MLVSYEVWLVEVIDQREGLLMILLRHLMLVSDLVLVVFDLMLVVLMNLIQNLNRWWVRFLCWTTC